MLFFLTLLLSSIHPISLFGTEYTYLYLEVSRRDEPTECQVYRGLSRSGGFKLKVNFRGKVAPHNIQARSVVQTTGSTIHIVVVTCYYCYYYFHCIGAVYHFCIYYVRTHCTRVISSLSAERGLTILTMCNRPRVRCTVVEG